MAYAGDCQLYIEQEIEDRWAAQKTPGRIAKELKEEIKKLFEIDVKEGTLKKRVQRWVDKKTAGTKVPESTTPDNHSENHDKQEKQEVTDKATKPGPGRRKKYEQPKEKEVPPKPPQEPVQEPVQACTSLLTGRGKQIVEQLKLWGQGDPGFITECQEVLSCFKDQPRLRELLIASCPVCGSKGAGEEAPSEMPPGLTHFTQEIETQRKEVAQH